MKTRDIVAGISVLVFLVAAGLTLAGPSEEKAAVKAAQEWLSLVDGGRYAESWTGAATLFKGAVPQEQWTAQVKAVREPLGRVLKRTVKSKQYRKTLPGAPDGEYVVIQFETSFANKKSSIETVTPMLDKDRTWRVSGYYIR